MFYKYSRCLAAMLLLALTAGCLDESDDSSSAGNESGGGSCGYTDIVSNSERSSANACGEQVSLQYVAADAYLNAAIEACQQGMFSEADAVYSDYESQVQHARSVYEGLCDGSAGGGFSDDSDAVYINLCGSGDDTACHNSIDNEHIRYGDTRCPWAGYSFISQHSSFSDCSDAADAWADAQ
jgi:hypothetical protein